MNGRTASEWFQKLIQIVSENKDNVAYWNTQFDRFARLFGRLSGRPIAFNIALAVILVWMISGPIFGFSDTWQLVINTATTIVTFLMVFLIQHTQNRDTEALQVKLDELIRAVEKADNALLDLEEMEEEELALLRRKYVGLARVAREERTPDTSPKGDVGQ
jgi:low affinity Fe/Cu permease